MSYLQSTSSGVVPYLGTYLTVLTMLDTALPDTTKVNNAFTFMLEYWNVLIYSGTSGTSFTRCYTGLVFFIFSYGGNIKKNETKQTRLYFIHLTQPFFFAMERLISDNVFTE